MRWPATSLICIHLLLLLCACPAAAGFFSTPEIPLCTLAAGPLRLSIAGDDTRVCGARSQGSMASITDASSTADCTNIPGAAGGGAESLLVQWDASLGTGGEWKCAGGALSGCTEDWVAYEQNSGTPIGIVMGGFTVWEQIGGSAALYTETASSTAVAACFEWGTEASLLHVKYVCAHRYWRVEAVTYGLINTAMKAFRAALGKSASSTPMAIANIVPTAVGSAYSHLTNGAASVHVTADIAINTNDYLSILANNEDGIGTPQYTALEGTKFVFTSATCTRGTP